MPAIVSVEQVSSTSKITYDNNEVLYSWLNGRILIRADQDTIERQNLELSPEDAFHSLTLKYSDQVLKYGTSTAEEWVEYLLENNIFFSDVTISTISATEAFKMTQVGKILYLAWAKVDSPYASAVWKCAKFDETDKLDTNKKWADAGKYSQVATDLTILTYL